jgi:FG-GAP repeat protein/VCBS repeat protein
VLGGPDGTKADFGISVASAGDVNGDGYADVVVGSWKGSVGNVEAWAQVYLGGPCGLQPTAASSLAGPVALAGVRGIAVASAGDLNGDGFGDVVVGADGTDHIARGALVYLGGAGGLSSTADAVIVSPSGPGGTSGAVASAGDVNGDGFADLVLGADLVGALGHAYIYLGGVSGVSTTAATTLTEPVGGGGAFGTAVASAGDVNGDGFADVVVGGGGAYLFFGGAGGVATTATAVLKGTEPDGGDFGDSVASAGDVDGDGFADIVVGAAGEKGGVGAAYAYPGNAGGLSTAPATSLIGMDGVIGAFGGSVACAEVRVGRSRKYLGC